ncbi:MAG: YbjN domain-containing protein [Sphingomonadaceae bacterium]|nr:YbjN domain-containing protein [Sphingomonadaceae bacterium]
MSADDLLQLEFEHEAAPGAPIDILEAHFTRSGWACERHGDEEIVASVECAWGTYELRALWRDEDSVLQVVALTGLSVPEERRAAAYELAGRVNEQLWLGHFDLWSNDGQLLFRHAAVLPRGREEDEADASLDPAEAEALIDAALDECDRYYPAFQFVIGGAHDARQALAAALIDVAGEA